VPRSDLGRRLAGLHQDGDCGGLCFGHVCAAALLAGVPGTITEVRNSWGGLDREDDYLPFSCDA